MRWIVGDIQGCVRELERLVREIDFRSGQDELWCLGDLVNRGPDSLAVLRLWRSLDGRGVLGNHDVHAILHRSGARWRPKEKLQPLEELFAAPDADELVGALRDLPVLVHLPSAGSGPDVWAVHAGLHPGWADVHAMAERLNAPAHDDAWLQSEEIGFVTNVRCCTAEGQRSDHVGPPVSCPPPFWPWDTFYSGKTMVVHGHWAARGHYRTERSMGLDSGCVYGGGLTAWCQDEDRVVRVPSGS